MHAVGEGRGGSPVSLLELMLSQLELSQERRWRAGYLVGVGGGDGALGWGVVDGIFIVAFKRVIIIVLAEMTRFAWSVCFLYLEAILSFCMGLIVLVPILIHGIGQADPTHSLLEILQVGGRHSLSALLTEQ